MILTGVAAMRAFIDSLMRYGLEFLGLYYSSYRGFVTNVDDPEGLGRIRVLVPEIGGNTELPRWAYPMGLPCGPNMGSQFTPTKGDVVWVSFEKGNPNYPLWTFSYYAKGEKPKEFEHLKYYGWRTPDGISLVLDDKDFQVRLILPNKDSFHITDKGISLVTTDNRCIFLGSLDSAKEFSLMGETLKKELEIEKARVSTIIQALLTSPTALSPDAGALYKKGITTALTSIKEPNYSEILSKKVKND